MASSSTQKPACKNLVLDAGPLLSLSPLRGLAETFYTVPQVLSELKDKRAREHFEQLGLSAGVRIQVESPDPKSLAEVIQFAKKTGDYAVLSTADLCILALTHALEQREKAAEEKETNNSAVPAADQEPDDGPTVASEEVKGADEDHPVSDAEEPPLSQSDSSDDEVDQEDEPQEPLDVQLEPLNDHPESASDVRTDAPSTTAPDDRPNVAEDEPVWDDPSDEDDDEGEWITPSNVALHKSRALQLIPDEDAKARKGGPTAQIRAGCMTADFAMQNVLLQMGLSLVGVEGKRIERVKTWVLRCHACFKICKDSSRKFCPSCGNPTLLRAAVTISSPKADASTPTLQVHLKKNFQYKTRGTKYSIPAPKSGTAKTGPGEGLILREDQTAYVRARKLADGKREREEKRMLNGARGNGGVVVGSWMDPDWMPEMLSVGTGGQGRNMRSGGMDGDMPAIGYGRRNPNERRRRK